MLQECLCRAPQEQLPADSQTAFGVGEPLLVLILGPLLSCTCKLRCLELELMAVRLMNLCYISQVFNVFYLFLYFFNLKLKSFGSISALIQSTHETKLLFPRQRSVELRPLWQKRIHNALASNSLWNPKVTLPGSQKHFLAYGWICLLVLWSFKKPPQ